MTRLLDDRGVSEVMGAVMVFAIVVTLLGILQTMAVPQQNADVEFKHSQQVADEMVDLRAAALESARTGETTTATVTLGTDYPSRFVLLNPGAASGTLRTTGAGELELPDTETSVQDVCGTDEAVTSRSLVYEPTYNVYDSAPTTGYEHGFTYRKYEDDVLVDGEQTLVRGNTITMLPFVDEYQASGVQTASIDISSTGLGSKTIETTSEFSLTVPTKLAAHYWDNKNELLGGEDKVDSVDPVAGENRIEITFEPGEYRVRCSVLGTGAPPEANPPERSTSELTINPNGEGAVVLTDTRISGEDSALTFEYEPASTSSDTEVDIVAARIPFYHLGGPGNSAGPKPTEGDISGEVSDATTLSIGGRFTDLDEDISIDSDSTEVTVDFDEEVKSGHWYVLRLQFSNGDVSTYFIGH